MPNTDPDNRADGYFSAQPSGAFPVNSEAWWGARTREERAAYEAVSAAQSSAKAPSSLVDIGSGAGAGGIVVLGLVGYALYVLFIGLAFEILFGGYCLVQLAKVTVPRSTFYSAHVQNTWFGHNYVYGYASLTNLVSCLISATAILLAVRGPIGRWISLAISASIIFRMLTNNGFDDWQMPADERTTFYTMLISLILYRLLLTRVRRDMRWIAAAIGIAAAMATALAITEIPI